MTCSVETAWVCDKCRTQVVEDGSRIPPDGWIGLQIHPEPLSSDQWGPRFHLCSGCSEELRDALNLFISDPLKSTMVTR